MVSKTVMIIVSLAVANCLTLALPQAAINPKVEEDNLVDSCKCVPYYRCRNSTSAPGSDGVGSIDIRFDGDDKSGKPRPCNHYLDVCCPPSMQVSPEQVTRPLVPKKDTLSCGNRNPNGVGFRITGAVDHEAMYGEFPWMVALLRKEYVGGDVDLKVMECGASIIHKQVVLTAAHCVKQKKNLFVRAGEWDSQTEKELYVIQERDVKEVIIHEDYYGGALFNDVALLVLDKPLEFTDVVGPICLPRQGQNFDNLNCVVTGWGKDSFGKEGKYQVILKKIDVPVVPREPCQTALRATPLGEHFNLDESFMCAGGQEGKDACKGDGGSPLVCTSEDNPKQYIQAGIVAWGIGCGTETPAVYANVPYFRDWIDGKLENMTLN